MASVTRHGRCPETAGVPSLCFPASGTATGRPAVRLCPPRPQRPLRPYKAPEALTMSLEGEQRAEKEKGKVGIIKKVCECIVIDVLGVTS